MRQDNLRSLRLLASRREAFLRRQIADQRTASPSDWPPLLLSVVTFNSRQWIQPFVERLLAQRYPLDRIRLVVVDHESSDETLDAWAKLRPTLEQKLRGMELIRQPNRGFGAGHNRAVQGANEPWLLVSNVDLEFEPDTIPCLVRAAQADEPETVSWEARQKPFEHPHYYDPVTLETEYSSHACALFRLSAFRHVGGYDERLFMYGEDAELSYRFRQRGYRLRYVPGAVVWHWCYDPTAPAKPAPYCGSRLGNALNRLRYGSWLDVLWLLPMWVRLRRGLEAFPDGRQWFWKTFRRFLWIAPLFLVSRVRRRIPFPFHGSVYAYPREGAFVPGRRWPWPPGEEPTIRVRVQSAPGRGRWLEECLSTVARQTYPVYEVEVVERNGSTLALHLERWRKVWGPRLQYRSGPRAGTLRTSPGDLALQPSPRTLWVFMDDRALWFADHLEWLVTEAQIRTDAPAIGGLYWESPVDADGYPTGPFRPCSGASLGGQNSPFSGPALPFHALVFREAALRDSPWMAEEEALDATQRWMAWLRTISVAWVPRTTSILRQEVSP